MMKKQHSTETMAEVLDWIKHYLPSQGPLKDFIHHNTLHAFQDLPFHQGVQRSATLLGHNIYLPLDEYIALYHQGKIEDAFLEQSLCRWSAVANVPMTRDMLFEVDRGQQPNTTLFPLRKIWKSRYQIDLEGCVHPYLFKILCSYLDQGISIWSFPASENGFLSSLRRLDKQSLVSVFPNASSKARRLLHDETTSLSLVLTEIVGTESLFSQYIFEQQFLHPGWSGLVAHLEDQPESLLSPKKISFKELVLFELLLELDVLEQKLGPEWTPIGSFYQGIESRHQLKNVGLEHAFLKQMCWQEAFEKTYYNSCLRTLKPIEKKEESTATFQALFCIDDRECSFRRHLESLDPSIETFGTPGFFGVEFYYQPENSQHLTKLCPAPVKPRHLIQQSQSSFRHQKDLHFHSISHSFLGGWLISQTVGFYSAFKLFLQIFRPSLSPATATSLRHMDKMSQLSFENTHPHHHIHGLQVGFTISEMVERVAATLLGIGLNHNFSNIIYVVSHGSSTINNPHFAAYDCGACSGRPGSVNARVFALMANHPQVRHGLVEKGIQIPRTTLFIGALHDTTRDEIEFYEEKEWAPAFLTQHQKNVEIISKALALNSKERSRRFLNMDLDLSPQKTSEDVKIRSVSLFEPRPELNHATNALCIIGRRALTKNVFLDRRAFLNSYDYSIDPEGLILTRLLNAVIPVCGGINLEYYFSRVDNHKMGAGTKLPHNVMGLLGVANGIDGDLRPGLPSQMIEVHDPLRLLIVVEHHQDVVLKSLQQNEATFEWIKNEWVRVACFDPLSGAIHLFEDGQMKPFQTLGNAPLIENIASYVQSSRDRLEIGRIKD